MERLRLCWLSHCVHRFHRSPILAEPMNINPMRPHASSLKHHRTGMRPQIAVLRGLRSSAPPSKTATGGQMP
jgi:hypothetical protein